MRRSRVVPLAVAGSLLSLAAPSASHAVAPAAPAAAAPAAPVRARVHLSWNGYDGVHPGENLHAAARHLHRSVAEACGGYFLNYIKNVGHGVYIDSGAALTVVNEILVPSDAVGPAGIHKGMPNKKVEKRLGRRLHFVRDDDNGTLDSYVVGPHGHTLFSFGDHGRWGSFGLAPSPRVAKRDLQIEGC